ncbi:uncharacterized protein DSM5745_08535 [Aspergillus mulundensis]|uniref:Integral membrane protein n=1 Tax=Aspergillus mulundensis TaxID=1810919 RepID=A0A3D8R3Z2_9EURO|nr:hypothetical protein DSM5745_08535 [Aspergillus mulundensis]RDW68775.1 hypothetical protein DSM5745_08535 [Aspergillus mulundensis]
MVILSVLYLSLSTLALAQNNTSDVERVGWASSPDTRSTSEILFGCFSIFLVCSWKCVHLNLPSVEESEAGWHTTLAGWLPYWPTKPARRLIFRKVKWMLAIALAPEVGVALAAREFLRARKLQRFINLPTFTLSHGFFAYMGGFVIAIPDAAGQSLANRAKPSMKNYYLSARGLEALLKLGIFEPSNGWFPTVTEADIQDRSKSDPFTKAFAVVQCGWLVIQSIARAAQSLPLTELELATLAFIPCAFVMYAFWWYKPFDAQRPITLVCLNNHQAYQARLMIHCREKDAECYAGMGLEWGDVGDSDATDIMLHRQQEQSRFTELDYDLAREILVPGWEYGGAREKQDDPVVVIFYIAAATFSAIHTVAWTWEFSSDTSRTLWRVFSLMAVCSLLLNAFSWALGAAGEECADCADWGCNCCGHDVSSWNTPFLTMVGVIAYGVARVGLIALTFSCFSSMPADVYKAVDWRIPHFS